MSPEEMAKLVKLLNMARSTEPHEAMTAIRKASEMVRFDWAAFFKRLEGGRVQYVYTERPSAPPDPPRQPEPEDGLEFNDDDDIWVEIENIQCNLDELTANQRKWFGIVCEAYEKYGRLSEKQRAILADIHEKVYK